MSFPAEPAQAVLKILSPPLQQKYRNLCQSLATMGKAVVAFSAGVDSTVVLKVALDVLGPQNVLAATGVSASLAQRELQSVKDLAALLGARLELVDTGEMDDPRYAANPANRCFYCKSDLFTRLRDLAVAQGCQAILSGVNADDTGDFRPGMQAGSELGVSSPLLEAGLTKADVRELAKALGLPNWEKPALACLASRVPYGTPITVDTLNRIEQAEAFLADRGFTNIRVRHHAKLARVEAPVADLPRLLQEPLRSELVAHLKNLGYVYVTVDLQGFRSGSANEALSSAAKARSYS